MRRINVALQHDEPVLRDGDAAGATAAVDRGIDPQLAAAGRGEHAVIDQRTPIRLQRQPVAGLIGDDAALVVESVRTVIVPWPEPGISVNAAVAVDHCARVDRRRAGGRPDVIEMAAEQIDAGSEVVVAAEHQLQAAERGDCPARACPAIQREEATADRQPAGDGDAGQLVAAIAADRQVAANQRAAIDAAAVQRQALECSAGQIDRAAAIVEAGLQRQRPAAAVDRADIARGQPAAIEVDRGADGIDRASVLPSVAALAEIQRAALRCDQPGIGEAVKLNCRVRAADRAVGGVGPGRRVALIIIVPLRSLDDQRGA